MISYSIDKPVKLLSVAVEETLEIQNAFQLCSFGVVVICCLKSEGMLTPMNSKLLDSASIPEPVNDKQHQFLCI